jgi:transcriptional regulator with XRE-family HTH domain
MTDDQIQPGDPHDPFADVYSLPVVLRGWREQAGWTQDLLAAKSGVSQKTISAIETNPAADPHDGTLYKLAEAFSYRFGITADSVYQDLIAAKNHKPAETVSQFAKRLDNLLQGHSAPLRRFFEEMIMNYYHDMVKVNSRAVAFQREMRAKKKSGSKPEEI